MNCRLSHPRVFCVLLLVQNLASAGIFVLEPEADVRILGIEGFENVNDGKEILSVYTAAGNVQRTLIRFDLNNVSVPQGEHVVSAVLSLVASTRFGASKDRPTEVYRVTVPWSEKSATWIYRDSGVAWSVPGGDYVGQSGFPDLVPYASNSRSPAEGETISWEIGSLVAAWLEEGISNYGLLLRSYEGNGLTFTQREVSRTPFPNALVIKLSALPLLRAELIPDGQVIISWSGENVGVLEENNILASTGWIQSGPAVFVNGRSQVSVPVAAAAQKFFRLRSP